MPSQPLAAVALVVGVLAVLVLIGVLVLILILVGVLVLIAVLVVHEDTSFCTFPIEGTAILFPVFYGIYPTKEEKITTKRCEKIVDNRRYAW